MKLPLVGQDYTNRSLAAAAQTSINVYAEVFEDPNEQSKNKGFLYGIPGRVLFRDLTTGTLGNAAYTPIRGIWTGGGRCFVAAGAFYMQLTSAGAIIAGTVQSISNASVNGLANSPVQFFPNGNQLFIVSGGIAYIDNGSGPTACTATAYAGTVTAASGSEIILWESGDKFLADGSWNGTNITMNGVVYVVDLVFDDQTLYVTTPVPGGGLSNVAYSHLGAPILGMTGAYLDEAFFVGVPNTQNVNFSAVNNGLSWNGLDFFAKISWPDYVRSILADANQLYVWGYESFEVWTSNPNSITTPFIRIDSASCRIGSVSPWSPISLGGGVFFMGGNSQGEPIAYMLQGFTPVRISQHAQEQAWKAAGLGPNCISYGYEEEGHQFWMINFGSQTWGYDTTTGGWHRRSAGTFAGGWTQYPTAYHSYIPEFGTGKHLTGGPLDGKVYVSSVATYADNGSDIGWQKALPHLYNDRKRMYFDRLELEMETGATAGSAPAIDLDYSDDRGQTFGNAGVGSTQDTSQTAGTAGQFSQRVYWPALGSSYDRVFRLTGQGQSRVALIDLELDMELGTN